MPRAAKLKVYRTPIGFHDAYVAAPSKKAAIEAWGSSKDVFTRGEAEIVTEAELTAEPLASPGKVIKRLRGTAAEQIAALPPDKPKKAAGAGEEPPRPKGAKPASPAKSTPRPSRTTLEAAEAAVSKAKELQATQRKALSEREAALARERRALEKKQADELARLGAKRDEAAAAYDQAIRRWRG